METPHIHSENEAQAAELQNLTLRNTLILQTVAEGIVGVDRRGLITFANQFAAQSIGKTVDEMVGADAHAVARHTRADGTLCDGTDCVLMNVFESGIGVYDDEASFVDPAGNPFPVEFSIVPAGGADAAGLDGAVMSFRNITARKRMQADLLEAAVAAETASRAKSQFLSNMSHELRTPLNAIIGYSEMLMEEAAADAGHALATDLGKIHQSGRHLLALIDNILEIARIEAGRMEIVVADFEIATLVYEVENQFSALPDANANTFTVTTAGVDLAGTLRTDIEKVRKILMSLLSNANKFSRDGQVTLEVRRPGDASGRVEFRVSDTGVGIPPEQLATLFDPFVQGDASSTRRYSGTGLGLALASRLARLLEGTIAVQTEPQRGSTFIVTLPDTMSQAPGMTR
jgi:PAS domain S-box-containing protein